MVRDDAAKAELRKQVGDIGLILSVFFAFFVFKLLAYHNDTVPSTLYESKGLEFDDV